MKTAEELFKYYADHTALSEGHYDYLVDKEDFISALHEFAKLHVQAALEQAAENAEIDYYDDYMQPHIHIDKQSILTAYPLDNIK